MRNKARILAALTGSMLLLTGCGSSDNGSDVAEPSAEPTTAATPAPAPSPTKPSVTKTTPTPSASPTAAKPTGRLIDYETADESGATITTAADTSKLTGAPADFKSFIASQLGKKPAIDDGCTELPQIYVSRVDTGGWARGGAFIPQCGGYATLWAKSNGGWQGVWSGQSLVDCKTLNRFKFPARVAGDSCLNGEDAVVYSG